MTVEIFISHVNTHWETCHVNRTQYCRLDYLNASLFIFFFSIEVLGFNLILSYKKIDSLCGTQNDMNLRCELVW